MLLDFFVSKSIYAGLHDTGDWFLVWLDTDYPGELIINNGTQERPVVTIRTMGGPLTLHLLTSPDLTSLMKKQHELMGGVKTPPAWSLGYHLCRSSASNRAFSDDIEGMDASNIPYDTDCIDEQLVPSAFELNNNENMLQDSIFQLLKTHKKQFILPLVIQRSYDNEVGGSEGCLMSEDDNECYRGTLYTKSVMYPDMGAVDWIKPKLETLLQKLKNNYDTTPTGEHYEMCFCSLINFFL